MSSHSGEARAAADGTSALVLTNCVAYTMDAGAPTIEALTIGGDHITALGVDPSGGRAERVDLGGACVLPGFTDAHVHFPTWAMARRQAWLGGASSLGETLARVKASMANARPDGWLRGRGWRSADWQPAEEPTRHGLDPITGETPVALLAHDGDSLWLNSAALARADGDLGDVGVVERDESGQPKGILREHAAWRFRDRYAMPPLDAYVAAMRDGLGLAHARGVTAIHDKDGWSSSGGSCGRPRRRAPAPGRRARAARPGAVGADVRPDVDARRQRQRRVLVDVELVLVATL
jgi:predicted amidohydrolase YtcJ